VAVRGVAAGNWLPARWAVAALRIGHRRRGAVADIHISLRLVAAIQLVLPLILACDAFLATWLERHTGDKPLGADGRTSAFDFPVAQT